MQTIATIKLATKGGKST